MNKQDGFRKCFGSLVNSAVDILERKMSGI